MSNLVLASILTLFRKLSCSSVYDTDMDYEWSMYLHERKRTPYYDPARVKSVFAEIHCVRAVAVRGHTHGRAAAARSTASLLMDDFCLRLGAEAKHYQGSAADVRNGRSISRTFHWGKDQMTTPAKFDVRPEDVICMTDVDYYIDMPGFLNGHYNTMLIYTFQPSRLARDDGDTSYTFDEHNRVHYKVSGGGAYTHQVWNYAGDSLGVAWQRCGVTYRYTVYALERRQIDDDHQLILLTPMSRHWGASAIKAKDMLKANPLRRFELVVPEPHHSLLWCMAPADREVGPPGRRFVRMMTNSATGCVMHTGLVMSYSTATVPVSVDDAIASVARSGKAGLTHPMVKGKMCKDKEKANDVPGSEILYEYHKTHQEIAHAMMSHTEPRVHSYQFVERIEEYDPAAKPSMIAFMDPLVDGAFAPVQHKSNDKRSIDTRVEAVKDRTKTDTFTRKVVKAFVKMLKRDLLGERLHPYGEEELREKQNRPMQRRILDEAENLVPERKAKSFMKRETYQNLTDPRNITTINGVDKRDYSYFMYALADFVKKFDWYAFGKTPRQLSQRVADVCTEADFHVMETDFSRMDGRVGDVARYLEQAVVIALFHPMYHDEIYKLLKTQVNLPGKTREGVTYVTGLSRLSGSPETSVFNTILNVFVAFLCFRKMRNHRTGAYYTDEEAWKKLGVYGGDDGVTPDADPKIYVQAALSVGQHLTADVKMRGEKYVTFLSRFYGPDVWHGDANSCCDYARVMTKFHTTVSLPSNISAQDKLFDKAYALYLSDGASVVIGKFVTLVNECKPRGFKFRNIARQYLVCDNLSEQYVNFQADWMWDLFHTQLPGFNLQRWDDWLQSNIGNWVHGPLHLPYFMDSVLPNLKTQGTVIVDDQIINNPGNFSIGSPPPPVKTNRRSTKKGARRKSGSTVDNRSRNSGGKQRDAASPTKTGSKGSTSSSRSSKKINYKCSPRSEINKLLCGDCKLPVSGPSTRSDPLDMDVLGEDTVG